MFGVVEFGELVVGLVVGDCVYGCNVFGVLKDDLFCEYGIVLVE